MDRVDSHLGTTPKESEEVLCRDRLDQSLFNKSRTIANFPKEFAQIALPILSPKIQFMPNQLMF